MTGYLTGPQRAFVRAYLRHGDPTQAALDAGYAGGDVDRCRVWGEKLLRKESIKQAISGRKNSIGATARTRRASLGQSPHPAKLVALDWRGAPAHPENDT